jgi:hypothetical protein
LRPTWKQRLKWSGIYRRLVGPLRDGRRLRSWRSNGRPVPPPEAWKRRLVAEHAARGGCRLFIETGTSEGEMVAALAPRMRRVVSIELDSGLAALARRRFHRLANVEILTGDSEELLPRLLDDIAEPCLFWLDAHATSFGARGPRVTPIRAELAAILAHPVTEHRVLIDDARLFAAGGGYPSLDELRAAVAAARPGWTFELADDVVRILPG